MSAIVLAFTQSAWLNPYAPGLALLCLLFAALMQVASNFINDYMDHRDGIDTSQRLGPERACQQGWIEPKAMRWGIVLCIALALLVGLSVLALLLVTSRWSASLLLVILASVGVLCVLGAFAYSWWFSRWGLGDVLVLLFFGLIPTAGTYFILTDTLSAAVLVLGGSIGFAVDALLVVNNFRDRHTDRAVGKHTLVNLLPSDRWGWALYPLVGTIAVVLLLWVDFLLHHSLGRLSLFSLLYLWLHCQAAHRLWCIGQGRALNAMLGLTSRNLLLFTLLVVVALLTSKF